MRKRNREKIIRHTTECGSIILTFLGKDHKEEMIFKSDEEYQKFLLLMQFGTVIIGDGQCSML